MSFATKVTIDSVDVTSYCLNYEIVDTISGFTTINIAFSQHVQTYLDFNTQSEIIVTRGLVTSTDYTIFRGVISEIIRVSAGMVEIKGYDKLWLLERKSMTKTYDINIDIQAGVISAIAEDIIESYGGMTADVVSSGAVFTLDKYYCLNNTLMELLDELADLVDYAVYYDPETDTVNFKPKGYDTYPDAITVGTDIINIPNWNTNYAKLANIVTITGDYQELETTEDTVATALQTVFTLSKVPTSVKVYDNGTLKIGGVIGQTVTYDYSVDKENRTITFLTGITVGHTIQVAYSYLEPIIVTQKNPFSRVKYGDYTYNKYMDTIKSTADAEIKVQEIINKFGEPFYETNLMVVRKMNIRAGMYIDVVDGVNTENRTVLVRRIKYKYPEVVDEVTVDDEPLFDEYISEKMFAKRIGRLERRNLQEGTIINQLFGLARTAHFRRKTIKAYKKTIAGSTGIYGHPVQGIYGLAYYGQSGMIWGHSKFGTWEFVNWGTVTSSFILGHGFAGLLGTSKLGVGNATPEVLFYSKTYTYP